MNYTTFIFYKPYQVLCQFSAEGDKKTLASYFSDIKKDVYPVGRLDYDSEGLLVLSNDKQLNHRLLDPSYAHEREYWVQVEGTPTEQALAQLRSGVDITVDGKIYRTKPATVAWLQDEPIVPERNPPIRFRKSIPTSWLSLSLTEGKNRQVRKMTAAVNLPTLRLIRRRIGNITIEDLAPGDFINADKSIVTQLFQNNNAKIKIQTKMTNIFEQAKEVYNYNSFLQLAETLLSEGKTTGDNQSEEYLFYAKLNLQRMQRWNKTFTLREDVANAVKDTKPQTWWLITEGWCGDGAQNLPALAKMEEASEGNIKLNIVLRDENPTIIEQYLTNGTKSIPVLVAFDNEGNQLFRWGPRPVEAQALLSAWKNEQPQRPFEEFEKEMHTWYTKDKGNAVQDEILALLQK